MSLHRTRDGSRRARYLLFLPSHTAVADFHRLDADADHVFLKKELVDPLTRVAFLPTNRVARCKTCGLVTLRETWEAVGGCPNGHTGLDRWDPEKAAAGDGQLGAPPVVAAPVAAAPVPPAKPPTATKTTRPAWLIPFLAVLGVAALVAVGVLIARSMGGDDAPPPAPAEAGPDGPAAVAANDGETTGDLSEGDFRTVEGHFQDLYTFAADSSGRTLVFTLATDDFEPDLYVTTPDGERVEAEQLDNAIDGDGGVETTVTRRMRVSGLRGPGTYRILVSTRQPLGTGAYTLTIRQESPVKALTAGAQPLAGTLGPASQQADGFFTDRYSFRGIEGREHTITIMSSAFAPSAVVDGNVRGQTERGADRVIYKFTPGRTGTYTLTVGSRERGKTGAYTVSLVQAPAPPPETTTTTERDRPTRDAPTASGGVLRAGGAATRDSLGAGQSKTYTFRGRVGDRVTVDARTDGFSPSLVLIGPDGQRVAGPADGDRARVRSTLATEGTYRVIVTGSGAGTFSVELGQRAAPTSDDIPRLPGQAPRPPAPTPPPTPTPTDTPPAETDGEYTPAPIGDGTRPTPQP